MDEGRKEARAPAAWTIVACVVVAVVVVYPLSSAPMFLLLECYRNELDQDHARIERGLQAFYAPLIWADERSEPVEKFFTWYFDVWMATATVEAD